MLLSSSEQGARLIPGDPAALCRFAGQMRDVVAQGLTPGVARSELAEKETEGWAGEAADATRTRLEVSQEAWGTLAQVVDGLARGVDQFAMLLFDSQAQADQAAQLQAQAEAAWPYPVAFYWHAKAELILSYARERLRWAADQLAALFEEATEELLSDEAQDGDYWDWLEQVAPQAAAVLGDLATMVLGGALFAAGTGLDATGVLAPLGVPAQSGGAVLAAAGAESLLGVVVGSTGIVTQHIMMSEANQALRDETPFEKDLERKQTATSKEWERIAEENNWRKAEPNDQELIGKQQADANGWDPRLNPKLASEEEIAAKAAASTKTPVYPVKSALEGYAERIANRSKNNEQVAADLTRMQEQLQSGNLNPGKENKRVAGTDAWYSRASNGGRLFWRKVGDGIEVIGECGKDKTDESALIRWIQNKYRPGSG